MRLPVLILLAALAGCSQPETAEPNRSGDDPTQPVAGADFQWTGRFAATPELCTGGVWDIGERRIVTDGETSCDVDRVARAAGQVTLRLACTAEGTQSREDWVLTRRGEGMRVARNDGRETVEVDLIRCG